MTKLDRFLLRIIKVSLYLMVFASLLLSAKFFFPLIFPKIIFIRLLIEIIFLAYIPLAVRNKEFRPKWNLFYVAGAVFAGFVWLTAITGVDFNFSFWGNYERMDGIFTWLHFWALIVMAGSVLKKRSEWSKVLCFSVLAAILVSVYGFAQKAGASFVYDSGADRISATIGNPGFLAGYLLFNIGFGLLIFLDQQANKILRLAALAAAPVLLTAFIFSSTRGAFLGAMVGILTFAAFAILAGRVKVPFKKSLAPALGLIILLSALFLFRSSDFIQNNNALGKLTTFNLADSTVQTRLISWRSGLAQLRDDFWLGVGPQKFDYVFNKYFDPQFYKLVGSENWWDRAHNMAVEILVTMGILGFLAYLFCGVAAFILILRLRKQSGNYLEAAILFSLLVAYFVQNLFIFDSVVSYLVLSLLLAYLISVYQAVQRADEQNAGAVLQRAGLVNSTHWLVFAGLAFLLVALSAWAGNIKLIKHNRLIIEILTPNQQSWDRKIELFTQTLALSDFDRREVAIRTGYLANQLVASGQVNPGAMLAGYNTILAAMDKIVAESPKDVRLLSAYGDTANIYADILKRTGNESFRQWVAKAGQALAEAIELGPGRQQIYYSLANSYLIGDETDKATEVLEQAKTIDPSIPETYWRQALFYAYLGRRQEAGQALGEALAKGKILVNENEMNPIAKVFIDNQDYAGLLPFYEQIAVRFDSAAAYGKLAALYAQMGRPQEAITAAGEVTKRDPSLQNQVDEFINLVRSGRQTDFISPPKR